MSIESSTSQKADHEPEIEEYGAHNRKVESSLIEEVTISNLSESLKTCYAENSKLGGLLEAISGLQLALQGVLEAMILIDRLVYALESNMCSRVQLIRVFDAVISPRCVAMILYK